MIIANKKERTGVAVSDGDICATRMVFIYPVQHACMVAGTRCRDWGGWNERERGDGNGDSLMHPAGGGHEPVDDLLVVYGEEDDEGEGDGERDIVPYPPYRQLGRA